VKTINGANYMKQGKYIRKLLTTHSKGYQYSALNLPSKIADIWLKLGFDHVQFVINDDLSVTLTPL
jgi:hypothetical protein